MKTNLEKVRAALVKAVPEILELKFGCSVAILGQYSAWADKMLGKYGTSPWLFDGFVFRNKVGTMDMADYLEHNFNFEILGRPIRLADVLRARQGKSSTHEYIGVDINGYFVDCNDDMSEWKILDAHWNLAADSLDEQSEETIVFLHSILCV